LEKTPKGYEHPGEESNVQSAAQHHRVQCNNTGTNPNNYKTGSKDSGLLI
jgi:hypothetical protein